VTVRNPLHQVVVIGIVRAEWIHPCEHYVSLRGTVEEYIHVEILPLHADSEAVLDSRHISVRREHDLILGSNLVITIDVSVADVTRHDGAAEDALVRARVNLRLTFEEPVSDISPHRVKRLSSLCLPNVRIVRFVNIDILVS